jgi:RNA polymerase sigma-70 factor (ECF subfamily)
MKGGRPELRLVVPSSPTHERPSGIVPRSEALDPEAVFRRHSGYVATVAHRLLGRDHEVDDTVQDVFVIAVRGIANVRDPGAIRAWLASITVRVARRRLRMRRARALLGLTEPVTYETIPCELASPEQRALIARVYQTLDRLPVAERVAWTLHRIEGETLDSVASLCKCSLATTKRRIQRVTAALKEAFDA